MAGGNLQIVIFYMYSKHSMKLGKYHAPEHGMAWFLAFLIPLQTNAKCRNVTEKRLSNGTYLAFAETLSFFRFMI